MRNTSLIDIITATTTDHIEKLHFSNSIMLCLLYLCYCIILDRRHSHSHSFDKYRDFHLQKVITVTIQQLALCDLMVIKGDYNLSDSKLYSYDCWQLDVWQCWATCHFIQGAWCFTFSGILFICVMITSKVALLKYPVRFGTM